VPVNSADEVTPSALAQTVTPIYNQNTTYSTRGFYNSETCEEVDHQTTLSLPAHQDQALYYFKWNTPGQVRISGTSSTNLSVEAKQIGVSAASVGP
jgi:hypothetical protein